ncbi:hypothetical protein GOC83_15385 [Haloarcula rubripromontorii]|uniref:Uncharacterized protein n=1 Tax=Haloarcula rubripromontorii TaxID=1705562 RepID=A0A847U559_9EURY|nr:hypothetical protein [Haloarcula rubripromontorii]NLV07517.1 hypothetical protein [Haloarcula rubripromontorii]
MLTATEYPMGERYWFIELGVIDERVPDALSTTESPTGERVDCCVNDR